MSHGRNYPRPQLVCHKHSVQISELTSLYGEVSCLPNLSSVHLVKCFFSAEWRAGSSFLEFWDYHTWTIIKWVYFYVPLHIFFCLFLPIRHDLTVLFLLCLGILLHSEFWFIYCVHPLGPSFLQLISLYSIAMFSFKHQLNLSSNETHYDQNVVWKYISNNVLSYTLITSWLTIMFC